MKLILTLFLSISLLWAQNRVVYYNLKLTIRLFEGPYEYVDDSNRYIDSKTLDDRGRVRNPIHIDTSYYIIDQECFKLLPPDSELVTFNDFVEVDTFLVKDHWWTDVNVFDDFVHYIWCGFYIDTKIVDYLIQRKLLSLRKEIKDGTTYPNYKPKGG